MRARDNSLGFLPSRASVIHPATWIALTISLATCVARSPLTAAAQTAHPSTSRATASTAPDEPSAVRMSEADDKPAAGAFPAEFDAGGATLFEKGSLTIPRGTTVRGDRYFVGNHTDIEGVLDGDFIGYSEAVSIHGSVLGDFNAGGRWIKIDGTINDDLRVGCEDIELRGRVGGDLMAGAYKAMHILPGASVAGSSYLAGVQMTLSGVFAGPVHASGGKITFDGTAEHDVFLKADVIEFKPGALIKGKLTYTARNEIPMFRDQTEEGKKIVMGAVIFNPAPTESKSKRGAFGFFGLLWLFATFVGGFLVGVVLIALCRGMVATITRTAQTETLKSLGFGVLGHILAPFAGVVLICLCFTFPAGILVLMVWAIFFYLSKLVVSLALADGVLRKLGFKPSPYLSLLLGMIVLWILFMIPVLGTFLKWFIVPIFGIGALLIGLRAHSLNCRAEIAPPPQPASVVL